MESSEAVLEVFRQRFPGVPFEARTEPNAVELDDGRKCDRVLVRPAVDFRVACVPGEVEKYAGHGASELTEYMLGRIAPGCLPGQFIAKSKPLSDAIDQMIVDGKNPYREWHQKHSK